MKSICRFLIALMIWAPYQFASAGMISTEQAGASAERASLVSQLQASGVDRASAEERIAVLSDQEARTLAAEVANAPAAGVYGEGIVAVILIALILYAWYKHRNPW